MQMKIAIASILGLSATIALGQGPRRATLLPPVSGDAVGARSVARAAAESLPITGNSTPITQKSAGRVSSPAWLNGTESNIRQANGTGTNQEGIRLLTPPNNGSSQEPTFVSRGFDKIKNAFIGSDGKDGPKPAVTQQPAPEKTAPAPAVQQQPIARETPNAITPFQGVSPNGQPIFAGPPAWRWNGYGAPTPGANPYAPTGHYPRASANWYSITGATPGAFPVPVTNSFAQNPGTDPPVYVHTPTQRVVSGPAYAVHPITAPYQITPTAPTIASGNVPPMYAPLPTTPTPIATEPAGIPLRVPTLTPPPLPVHTTTPTTPVVTPVTELEPPVRIQTPGDGVARVPLLPNPGGSTAPLQPLPTLPPVSPALPSTREPNHVVQPVAKPAVYPVPTTEELPQWQPSNPRTPRGN